MEADRQRTLEQRVVRAAEAALDKRKFVTAIDVLVGLGWLTPIRVDEWRQGRVDYLERVTTVNLSKLSTAMQLRTGGNPRRGNSARARRAGLPRGRGGTGAAARARGGTTGSERPETPGRDRAHDRAALSGLSSGAGRRRRTPHRGTRKRTGRTDGCRARARPERDRAGIGRGRTPRGYALRRATHGGREPRAGARARAIRGRADPRALADSAARHLVGTSSRFEGDGSAPELLRLAKTTSEAHELTSLPRDGFIGPDRTN